MSDRFRPVVALDVDGVLRLIKSPVGSMRDEEFTAKVTMRREAYPDLFHSQPPWDEDGLHVAWESFSGVGARWARSIIDRGLEVVWATTWQEHANTYFANILGIPDLPNALVHERPRFSESAASWKARNLRTAFPGRPILWVDDNAPYSNPDWIAEIRSPRDRVLTNFHHIKSHESGIAESDLEPMESWLELAGSPAGHRELRRRRRNQFARERYYDLH